ncbi:MAG: 30S ribosomal protein S6e [Thaumarchaeota archaeon]|nr:MAG: 30S ribosomal protein S6e [Nitrososphaerota archaeon]
MATFKLTLSDKKGRSTSKELKDNDANPLLGLRVGQETDASIVGLQGKIVITGGSDKSGVPMRADVHGMPRKRILIPKGVGLQDAEKGLRKRKLIRGNTISEEIYQVNCRYDGELQVEEPKKEAPKKEAPKKEAPKKEAPKIQRKKLQRKKLQRKKLQRKKLQRKKLQRKNRLT